MLVRASSSRRSVGWAEIGVARLEDDAGRALLLVSADAIWFSDAQAQRLRTQLARHVGGDMASVTLAATHTHGAPQPDSRFAVGTVDPAWQSSVEDAIREAADEASTAEHVPIVALVGRGEVPEGLSVHRRRRAWYWTGGLPRRRTQTLPNAAHRVDRNLTLIVLRRPDGSTLATLAHFACHPVAQPAGTPGPDYPGGLRTALRQRLGASTPVLFLQGYCGDIRPDLRHVPKGIKDLLVETIIGPRFRRSLPGDVGGMIGRMTPAMDAALGQLTPVPLAGLRVARGSLPVTLADGRRTDRILDVTAWRLGDGLSLVFASGEMLSGLIAREPGVISVGYANGMVGYVAPPEEFANGGYEVEGFAAKFGLAGPIAPDTGREFQVLRRRLLDEVVARSLGSPAS